MDNSSTDSYYNNAVAASNRFFNSTVVPAIVAIAADAYYKV